MQLSSAVSTAPIAIRQQLNYSFSVLAVLITSPFLQETDTIACVSNHVPPATLLAI